MSGKHDNPYVIAEKELLAVAADIEQSARKLALLKPRQGPKEADESLNFEDQILEAAKSITAAVGALVKAATTAQKELVSTGGVSTAINGKGDAEWSQGLISAARLTATATGALCDAAHNAVKGQPCEEKLVASAKAVATSTGQLLKAFQANANSNTHTGLLSAGAAVERAAGLLVNAATGSTVFQEEIEVNNLTAFNEDLKEELEIQEMILKKQRELEKARAKLQHIRETNRIRNEEEEDAAEAER